MTAYASSPHTAAALALLKPALPLVGDGIAPDGLTYDADQRLINAYVVLYGLGSSTFDGSLSRTDAQGDAWPTFQVTSVGRSREQAEWMRDKARALLLGQVLTVSGRQLAPLQLLDEQGPQRDDDVTPHLFYAIDRFRSYSTSG